MSTRSLKLSEKLKQRAEAAAQILGMSTHAFMVHAIRHAAESVEDRTKFVGEAQASRDAMLENGTGLDADEVRKYLRRRLSEKNVARPDLTPWRASN